MAKFNFSQITTMDTCRLCNTSRNHKELSKIDNKKLEIQKKLQQTFNIELTSSQDPSNNFCCRICIKKLNNSHSFYLQIVDNQKKFETANFEFNTVVVKVENFDDKSLNICGDIKVEKEENIVEDFGDSYDAGTFNDDYSKACPVMSTVFYSASDAIFSRKYLKVWLSSRPTCSIGISASLVGLVDCGSQTVF